MGAAGGGGGVRQPDQNSPRGGNINILNEKKSFIFRAQQILNY
jgi:hypothetical protein